MSLIKKIGCLALLSTGLFVSAQASAESTCDNAYTQTDMNKCIAAELAIEDQKLNQSYRDFQRLLNSSEKQQLKAVQLAWIDFRDKACQLSAQSVRGGSIYPMVLNGCLTTYTQQRRVQLDADIKSIKNK
ncbi:lysozyme inhibitor LprI family protein [Psychrobacter fjordensis]|uniref:lysozyme inhibitor LprI family protein n=1 Tax=Psychrobacter fjordensis TaxID=664424 RepID=UPI0019195658|nr:lysozyme inhibitor LprI family protein [Psychrobacter fjordensis]